MTAPDLLVCPASGSDDEPFFAQMADDVRRRGYAVCPGALPLPLCEALLAQLQVIPADGFERAGVGREHNHTLNRFVRSDEICWITGESAAGREWLDWSARLQRALNRQLLLGLFSFESHFAHYGPGDFYRKHLDAFRGQANRVLSLVAYLNRGWQPDDGGELLMYLDDEAQGETLKVVPALGTVVVFLSEEFPHEVLPAQRDRYSIAGWFRVNTSTAGRVDPPR
ncbi:2OG-Fe(II) oxygenase [Parahaliea aestuarii]|uniref:2OG-Fe(II) oxygenase n=1 Tax=Parahaliea aestuarii TaxID=1852021 RepID=A0A5C8ZPE4_9GAMM|nr:2OG-Fe(II) oxygenase [Parahaliea aestuarii]TXS90358.1 2OG-Fe(II) oxygenase [Parahaliea aestuarii]